VASRQYLKIVRGRVWAEGMKRIARRLEKEWKLTSVEPVIEHLEDLGVLLIENDQTLLACLRCQSRVKMLGISL